MAFKVTCSDNNSDSNSDKDSDNETARGIDTNSAIVTRVPQHHNSTSKTLYLVAQLIHDFTTFLERSSLVYNYPGCHALPLHLMALHFRLNCLLTYFPSKESVVPDTCT